MYKVIRKPQSKMNNQKKYKNNLVELSGAAARTGTGKKYIK